MQLIPSFLTFATVQANPIPEGPDLTRYFAVCGLIIALIIGLAYGFRRVFAASLRRRAAGRSLRVVDMLPLGGKQRLGVVRCYDRTFVLGLGEREVSLVAELDAVIGAAPAGVKKEKPETSDEEGFVQLLEHAQERIQSSNTRTTKETGDARLTELVG